MPLYEYRCKSCEKTHEVVQKFSDELLKSCPDCGGEVKKLISSPAIQFKGSGFYITDYAKGNSAATASRSETKSSSDGSSSETSKSDSSKSDSSSKPGSGSSS